MALILIKLYGIERCQETINAMVESAKVKASLGREDHDWMLHPDYVIDGVVSTNILRLF